MIKKVASLILTVVFVLSFAITTFAANSSPQWSLRPDSFEDWGEAYVDIGGTDRAVYVTVNQYGIHAGEQADTNWWITHQSTGKTEGTKRLDGDYYGTWIFSNLSSPGGIYHVKWHAYTSNDTAGWYQLYTHSSQSYFSRMK